MIGIIIPSAHSESEYTWSTYVHPEGNFSIDYPSTWIVEDYMMDEFLGDFGGMVYFYDEDDWNIEVEVWNAGSIPYIDTQSVKERYDGIVASEFMECTLSTFEIDGYVCRNFMPVDKPDSYGFQTLNSGERVYFMEYYTTRQYDPNVTLGTEVRMFTIVVDFMCCTNHVYSVFITATEDALSNYKKDELWSVWKYMLESFTFPTSSNSAGNKLAESICGEGTIYKDGQCILDQKKTTYGQGGCLIATAAYGSEMAPQVQFLREIRDGTVLKTQSGTAFMTGFNQFYYSFSPTVADYERESPVFKEAVKLTLTPLLTSLTLLNYVDIDTEQEMLGYGIGVILLNIGMYFVAPAVVIISLKRAFHNKV